MKIGDLVKRIKNWKPHEANAYWEDREWLEVINESR